MTKLTLGFFIFPHFISRYYLRKNIEDMIARFKFQGSVLDFGCGDQPYRSLFKKSEKYVGIDFKSYSKNKAYRGQKPDFYFPKNYQKNWRLPFVDASFDHVVSFQVMEHHPRIYEMLDEMIRILKKNGLIMFTAPFVWSLHEKPNDYLRFTPFFLKRLFHLNGLRVLEIKKLGSFFAVISSLSTDYLIELAKKNKFFYLCSLVFYPFLLAFSYLCILLDSVFKSENIFLNTIILAKKS